MCFVQKFPNVDLFAQKSIQQTVEAFKNKIKTGVFLEADNLTSDEKKALEEIKVRLRKQSLMLNIAIVE